jgi:hypothetical protein
VAASLQQDARGSAAQLLLLLVQPVDDRTPPGRLLHAHDAGKRAWCVPAASSCQWGCTAVRPHWQLPCVHTGRTLPASMWAMIPMLRYLERSHSRTAVSPAQQQACNAVQANVRPSSEQVLPVPTYRPCQRHTPRCASLARVPRCAGSPAGGQPASNVCQVSTCGHEFRNPSSQRTTMGARAALWHRDEPAAAAGADSAATGATLRLSACAATDGVRRPVAFRAAIVKNACKGGHAWGCCGLSSPHAQIFQARTTTDTPELEVHEERLQRHAYIPITSTNRSLYIDAFPTVA